MHGLANRALQRFVTDTYGPEVWSEITSTAALGFEDFETMLTYDPTITETVINATVFELGKPRETLLEDLGIYLVAHAGSESLRRLLRFGGSTFLDFLRSFEDVPGRAKLALPDRDFPVVEVHEIGEANFIVLIEAGFDGIGHILLGALRAMADDYGALATIEYRGRYRECDRLTVDVHEEHYAEPRPFDLVQAAHP